MGKFKVGDRVRYSDLKCAGVGVVTGQNEDDSWFVRVEARHRDHCPFDDNTTRIFKESNLAPATLTIQSGRYYITRDGRKVGPATPSGDTDYPWWAGESTYTDSGAWVDGLEDDNDLVAEADEPPAEPQTNKEILDELEAWIAEQDAIKAAGKGSTAGFTVPLFDDDDEPASGCAPIVFEDGKFKVRAASIKMDGAPVASIADIVRRLERLEAATSVDESVAFRIGDKVTLRATVTGKQKKTRVNITLDDVSGAAHSIVVPAAALTAA